MARLRNTNKIRDEYNALVDEINAQLKAIKKIDPDSITLDRYRRYFKKVNTDSPNYKTISTLRKRAKDVLKSGELSIKGHERSKANAIETLRRDGYDFINKRNFNSFMRFLDDARSRGLGSLYSSEQLLSAINEAKSKGLSDEDIKKNINRWAKDVKKDEEGKIIEVEKPVKLLIRKYGNKRK